MYFYKVRIVLKDGSYTMVMTEEGYDSFLYAVQDGTLKPLTKNSEYEFKAKGSIEDEDISLEEQYDIEVVDEIFDDNYTAAMKLYEPQYHVGKHFIDI